MLIVHHPEELRAFHGGCFVPTMGALHEGHQSLIRAARQAADRAGGDSRVVVSIFVNPTQFGPDEDFARYPRDLAGDAAKAEDAGADVVFAPTVEVMYPAGEKDAAPPALPVPPAPPAPPVPPLPAVATEPQLEDRVRPGHFAGVCQVVARLFDFAQPSCAFFGSKDFQQWRVIDEMVAHMHARDPLRWRDLRIIACPLVRDHDGLALSSRNRYLSPAQRERALGLSRALFAAKAAVLPDEMETRMMNVLIDHDLRVDYATVRDPRSLMPGSDLMSPCIALIAAHVDHVRLIDNCIIESQPTK